jgi:enoyl-CoA hydratase/carnithine racemase
MTVSTGGPAGNVAPANKDALTGIEGGIAWVTLNCPDKRNAINLGVVYEMVAALDAQVSCNAE